MENMRMNLTDLEKDVLVNGLYNNEYCNDPDSEIYVWANSIGYHCKGTQERQLSGVISSLSKKEIVVCEGHGNESTVRVTKKGMKVLKTLL